MPTDRSNFADLDVLAAGPVVAEASHSFDEYWNSEWAVPIQAFTGQAPGAVQVEQLMTALAARAAAFRDTDYARALRATDLGLLVRSGRLALIPARRDRALRPARQAGGANRPDRGRASGVETAPMPSRRRSRSWC